PQREPTARSTTQLDLQHVRLRKRNTPLDHGDAPIFVLSLFLALSLSLPLSLVEIGRADDLHTVQVNDGARDPTEMTWRQPAIIDPQRVCRRRVWHAKASGHGDRRTRPSLVSLAKHGEGAGQAHGRIEKDEHGGEAESRRMGDGSSPLGAPRTRAPQPVRALRGSVHITRLPVVERFYGCRRALCMRG